MKKVFAIALALVLALAAISSLALVEPGAAGQTTKLAFDSIAISTSYAVVNGGVPGVSSIADAGISYIADQAIYGVVKFKFDYRVDGTNLNTVTVNLKSDDVFFPSYFGNQAAGGSFFATHYVDKWGILQVPTNLANYATVDYSAANTGELTISMYAGAIAPSVYPNIPLIDGSMVTDIYVGFQAIVKAPGTKTEGKITGYVVKTSANFTTGFAAYLGSTPALVGSVSADVYEGTVLKYRIFKLTAAVNDTMGASGVEYVVVPVRSGSGSTAVLDYYGIGFKNAGASPDHFGVFTYRSVTMANSTLVPGSATGDIILGANTMNVNYGGFFYSGAISVQTQVQAILDYFGFSTSYNTALEDKHWNPKTGLTSEKIATFKYFGATIIDDDTDIDVPVTGDASASVLIVLGASALLAAAALFFVMKKVRD